MSQDTKAAEAKAKKDDLKKEAIRAKNSKLTNNSKIETLKAAGVYKK